MATRPLHVTSFPWRSLLQGAITVFKETHYSPFRFPTLAECMVKFNVSLLLLLHSYFSNVLLLTCWLLIMLMCSPQHAGKHFLSRVVLSEFIPFTNKHTEWNWVNLENFIKFASAKIKMITDIFCWVDNWTQRLSVTNEQTKQTWLTRALPKKIQQETTYK